MIGIIADDLTGASDSGVQLARQGYNTCVVFHLDHLQSEIGADVIVADTDSRALPAEAAYEQVKQAACRLQTLGITHVYKKLDSTLRGNLGSEVDAVMDVFPFDFALVAPAFPKIGRTTRDGIHYLNGTPIHETEIARDPKCPVLESNLMQLLGKQTRRKVGHIPLTAIRAGEHAMISSLEELKHQKVQLIVFDAVETDDLQRVVEFSKALAYKFLWVGSAGLADFLPRLLPSPSKGTQHLTVRTPSKPVLLVAGSLSKITKEQVDQYNSVASVRPVEFNPTSVLSEKDWSEEKERCRFLLREATRLGQDISLHVGTSPDQIEKTHDKQFQQQWGMYEVSRRIAVSLGELAAELLVSAPFQGVIMTGGDTAKAVCEHMGVSGIQLLDEVEPGIPVSQLLGKNELLAVTKAGAFGNIDSLVHALQLLKGEV